MRLNARCSTALRLDAQLLHGKAYVVMPILETGRVGHSLHEFMVLLRHFCSLIAMALRKILIVPLYEQLLHIIDGYSVHSSNWLCTIINCSVCLAKWPIQGPAIQLMVHCPYLESLSMALRWYILCARIV